MIIIHLVLKLNILPSLILLSVLVHTVISISIKKEIVVYLVGSFQQICYDLRKVNEQVIRYTVIPFKKS